MENESDATATRWVFLCIIFCLYASPFLRSETKCSVKLDNAVLRPEERAKDNPAPDAFFYDYPRLCFHADAAWHATLTDLYYEHLPEDYDGFRLLDMMSSWVSHLPTNR